MNDSDRMLIERACTRLVLQFAQANDDWDHDGIADCFTEDGKFARPIDPDNPCTGRETIRAMFRDRPKRLGRHLMTNIFIHADTPAEAHGRSYVTYLSTAEIDQPRPALAEPGIFVGWFDDVFALTPDGWRIASRKGGMALRSGGEIPTVAPKSEQAHESHWDVQPKNENERLVLEFFTALSTGDLDLLRPFLTPDSVWQPMVRDIPGAGEYRGDAILDEFLGPVRGMFRPGDPKVKVKALISDGETVAVESTSHGETIDGKVYDNSYAWVFRWKNGKLDRLHEYMDSHYVARLFGMTGA